MATTKNIPEQTPAPTAYERYEDEIVELLQMPGVDVTPLPKIEALELPRQTQKPLIFVLVNGGEFAEREEMAVVAQLETVQCELFIRVKNRRGKMGLFTVYEEAKKRLLGYRLQGAKTPIYFNSFGYVSGLHNYWQYALTFSFAAYSVQADQPDETPLIREITHEITEL